MRRASSSGQLCWLLEDGFLRSLGLPSHGAPAYSIVVDDLGIYYDASRASRLETLIAGGNTDPALAQQAKNALDLVRRHRLSKYNHEDRCLPPDWNAHPPGQHRRVLVVDQTAGDLSVLLGGAGPETFEAMLAAALAENPEAEIWVKAHPETRSGRKRGYFATLPSDPRIRRLVAATAPLALLEQMDRVYVVTSQMGFEALMLDKPVTCFGLPWYAAWGLTDDRHAGIAALRRRRPCPRTVEQLFCAAYLQYARYVDPRTGAPGTIFDLIDYLVQARRPGREWRARDELALPA